MTLTDLFLSQIIDPFRIGLLIALVFTAVGTARAVGLWLPMVAGIVFVAAIIPMTLSPAGADLVRLIGVGLLSNVAILVVLLILHAVWRRTRG